MIGAARCKFGVLHAIRALDSTLSLAPQEVIVSNVVICAKCDEPIYKCLAVGRDYAGATAQADDFVPLGDWDKPEDHGFMGCPKCGKLFACPVGEGQLVLKLEDGQWWPHPPIKLC